MKKIKWAKCGLSALSLLALSSCGLIGGGVGGGGTNPGRLVGGDYSLDINVLTGKTGDLVFQDGQRMTVVANGTSTGLGVATFPGTNDSFKGTLTFVDGPLAEYTMTEMTIPGLSHYVFTMACSEKALTVDLLCNKDDGRYSYSIHLYNEEKTVSCYLSYK